MNFEHIATNSYRHDSSVAETLPRSNTGKRINFTGSYFTTLCSASSNACPRRFLPIILPEGSMSILAGML